MNQPANPPHNPYTGIALEKTQLAAYIAETADTKPTSADERSDYHVESITHAAGSQLVEARLVVDLGAQDRHIENASLSKESSRQVEIWTLKPATEDDAANGDDSDADDARDVCLFWGEIVRQEIQIRDGQEVSVLIAQVLPAHFGEPIHGMLVWDPVGEDTLLVHHDPEFNPIVDEAKTLNKFDGTGFEPKTFPIWVDPDSVQTSAARTYYGGAGTEWTLNDIIQTLMEWRNEDETYVKNLSRSGINKLIDDPPQVTDLTLRRGSYLPEMLDAVLQPYGYNWFLKYIKKSSSEADPVCYIYQRGDGDEKTIDLQAVGERYDRTLTNLVETLLSYDLAGIANKVTGFGALKQREITIELYRAWATGDTISHSDANEPGGRKLAANEGGDYDGLRPEISTPWLGALYSIKRRPMEDCLTLRDGQRIPPLLQYSEDSGSTWKDAPQDWAFRYLQDQIGVYFTGTATSRNAIPDEVLDTDVRFRITCTVTTDKRIEHSKDATDDSPLSTEMVLTLDLSDRFQDRQRQATGGSYDSQLSGAADTQDDTADLEAFVDAVGTNEQSAQVNAELPLSGIHTEYQIGDLITEIKGRNISLNRNAREATNARYLQIVGIRYVNMPAQHTVITVQPYDT